MHSLVARLNHAISQMLDTSTNHGPLIGLVLIKFHSIIIMKGKKKAQL